MPSEDASSTEQDLVPVNGVLEGPFWPEPIRVIARRRLGRRVEIHGQGLQTRTAYDSTLTVDEIHSKVKVTAGDSLSYRGNPSEFRLAGEAWRIRLAPPCDAHLAG